MLTLKAASIFSSVAVVSSTNRLINGQLIQLLSRPSLAKSASYFYQKYRMHVKARCEVYPISLRDSETIEQVTRTPVPDDKVDWEVDFSEYSPPVFTAPFVLTASWADPELDAPEFEPQWNQLDDKINRKSHDVEEYKVDDGFPLNPSGRTGLKGRGVLGKWGPNHAADPVVTRWKREESGEVYIHPDSEKKVLEFVSIERKDGGGWAIPGGMVDPGECISVTLKREFMEEAMDSTAATSEENESNKVMVEEFFTGGDEVYKGYVDDPRNTDNSWMETVAIHFHDETGEKVGKMQLKAGDDAKSLEWKEIDSSMSLYASHKDFIEKVAEKLEAHW